jgi:hypothetical protein
LVKVLAEDCKYAGLIRHSAAVWSRKNAPP